ncbi:MAG: sulfotransferase [Lewinellaceae bacterium]|nr:sulfotransferase [Phaeodactylibacter sp.]MCB0615810.1 sulfotransferase [Phaeodactylibacter sp.]MCB9350165.1 sulfotransferase [Lewinellaceae bacterium]
MGKFGLHRWSRLWHKAVNPFYSVEENPLIILGNQKSGTTAIAKLIALACGEDVQLDIEALWEPNCKLILEGELGLPEVIRKNKRFFSSPILKEPNFSLLYPHLERFYDDAAFLLIVRDPRDNIRSILNRLDIPGNKAKLSPKDFRSVNKHWRALFDASRYDQGRNQYIELLAARWNLCADLFLRHPEKVMVFRYEDFLANKADSIYRIARKLGLEPRTDISSKVNVQYQPVGNHNISWEDFFGEDNLNRIEDICSRRMKKLGYQLRNSSYESKASAG